MVAGVGDTQILDGIGEMDVPRDAESDVRVGVEEILDSSRIDVHPGTRDDPVAALLVLTIEHRAGGDDRHVTGDHDRCVPGRRLQCVGQPLELRIIQPCGVEPALDGVRRIEHDDPPARAVDRLIRARHAEDIGRPLLAVVRFGSGGTGLVLVPPPDIMVADDVDDRERAFLLHHRVPEGEEFGGTISAFGHDVHDLITAVEDHVGTMMLLRMREGRGEPLRRPLLRLDVHVAEVGESEHAFGRRRDLNRRFLRRNDGKTERQSRNGRGEKVTTFDAACLFVHDTTISRRRPEYE